MVIFAVLMLGMLAVAGYTVYSTVNAMISNNTLTNTAGQVTFNSFGSALIHNGPFRDIVISLVSVYGVYFLASFLFLDFAHMFTSFVQYMLLLPSFVNILMVYAFCNTHDVSWGTKGDSGNAKDLGTVTQTNGGKVEIEVIEQQADMNAMYEKLIFDLKNPPKKEASKAKVIDRDDYQRNFRTTLVLWWMMTNAIAIAVISSSYLSDYLVVTSSDGNITNYYLAAVFWSVAGLSIVRFMGALGYLFGRLTNWW